MPKRVNNIFYSKIKFKKMLDAYVRARKGKRYNKESILYEMDLANLITVTLKEIYENKYTFGQYRRFFVQEPKKREVWSLPFKDRVVHQWYVEEFIKPIFVPKFIEDTYACIEGRGVHKAVKKLRQYMFLQNKQSKNFYILKCDIKKFFHSIDKEILFNIISRDIKDRDFLDFTRKILYQNAMKPIGIPIGNYTSQYFANIYLSKLDHYAKEQLKIKYYVRFMDDFI